MKIARLWDRYSDTFLVPCAPFLIAAIAFLPTLGFSQGSNLDSQLIQAVYHSDLASVKQLIADGANPNASDVAGRDCFGDDGYEPPPLHVAGRYAVTYPILVYLVDHGADLELRSKATDCMAGAPKEERTAVMEAAHWSEPGNVQYLLDKGAKADVVSKKSEDTLLSLVLLKNELANLEGRVWQITPRDVVSVAFKNVCVRGYAPIKVKMRVIPEFIKRGADINMIIDSPIIGDGKITLLTKLFSSYSDSQDPDLETYLEVALSNGANPNLSIAGGRPEKKSPLRMLVHNSWLTANKKLSILDILFSHNCLPSLHDLRVAANYANDELFEKIVERVPDINSSSEGRPFLYLSYSESEPNGIFLLRGMRPTTLAILLSHGLDINVQYGGETPIYTAAATTSGSCEMVKLIIAHGSKVNAIGPDNMTALMVASYVEYDGTGDLLCKVNALLDAGADATLVSRWKQTALTYFMKKMATPEAGSVWRDTFYKLLQVTGTAINTSFCCSPRPDSYEDENTALYSLMWKGFPKESWLWATDAMVAVNADLNFQPSVGFTPLMALSCQKTADAIEVAKALLNHGANKMLKTTNGKTVADYARACDEGANTELLDLLGE